MYNIGQTVCYSIVNSPHCRENVGIAMGWIAMGSAGYLVCRVVQRLFCPDTRLHNIFQQRVESLPKPSASPTKQINVDLDNLQEYCGIQPDEIGLNDWLRDETVPQVHVDFVKVISKRDLFPGYPLPHVLQIPEKTPMTFTFRGAVDFIVRRINQFNNGDNIVTISPYSEEKKINRQLFYAISNIKTKLPHLVPPPPRYWNACSAPADASNFWIGVILRMLLDQGQLKAYGQKGANYWVVL